ncbi:MAG: 3-keto-disaccharide hydrolase [Terriglobia bacterium]
MKPFIAALCIVFGMPWILMAAGRHAGSSGWVNITPRESLQEWTRVAIPPTRPLNPVSQWKVDARRHMIVCEGNGGHEWLRYDHEYKDFVFEVEWRLVKGPRGTKYNSGIFVRNNTDGSIWYQAQVGSASGGYFFGENPVHGTLARFNLYGAVAQNDVKPAGQWNEYQILCKGKDLTLWVNGDKQSQFTECNNPAGYIGLEAEGSRIEFRDLKVKMIRQ